MVAVVEVSYNPTRPTKATLPLIIRACAADAVISAIGIASVLWMVFIFILVSDNAYF